MLLILLIQYMNTSNTFTNTGDTSSKKEEIVSDDLLFSPQENFFSFSKVENEIRQLEIICMKIILHDDCIINESYTKEEKINDINNLFIGLLNHLKQIKDIFYILFEEIVLIKLAFNKEIEANDDILLSLLNNIEEMESSSTIKSEEKQKIIELDNLAEKNHTSTQRYIILMKEKKEITCDTIINILFVLLKMTNNINFLIEEYKKVNSEENDFFKKNISEFSILIKEIQKKIKNIKGLFRDLNSYLFNLKLNVAYLNNEVLIPMDDIIKKRKRNKFFKWIKRKSE